MLYYPLIVFFLTISTFFHASTLVSATTSPNANCYTWEQLQQQPNVQLAVGDTIVFSTIPVTDMYDTSATNPSFLGLIAYLSKIKQYTFEIRVAYKCDLRMGCEFAARSVKDYLLLNGLNPKQLKTCHCNLLTQLRFPPSSLPNASRGAVEIIVHRHKSSK